MSIQAIVIDLNQCIRCRTCMVACKVQNNIPPLRKGRVSHYRIRPVEWEEGKYPDTRRIFIPVLCMQCDNPACMDVCPEGAISKRADGIVVVDKTKCIACGACNHACPYGAPYLMDKADKCDFCTAERLDRGEKTPYCVQSCPGEAMVFGDLADASSTVSGLVSSGKAMPLCPEFGTGPRVYYVPPVWYRDQWASLASNDLFIEALKWREKDLADPQASAHSLTRIARRAGFMTSPLGGLAVGAVGLGVSLEYLAKRKQKVEEAEKGSEI